MGVSLLDVNNYQELFRSSNEGYGHADISTAEYDEKGKLRAKCNIIRQAPSAAVMNRHLNGEFSIGLLPITEAGTCHWGAIDIDEYDGTLDRIISAIYEYDMPICPCYSKSKKVHLFFFLSSPVQPAELQKMLRRYYPMFALREKTEMFPKQRNRELVDTPSWINAPYFGDTRKMIGPKMEELPLADMLRRGLAKRMSLKDHNTFLDVMPFSDAPPCVQSGCVLKDIPRGNRNNFLFSVGVYFRLKDEGADLDALLHAINNSLIDPIDDKRLEETILTGLKKKSYFYLCNSMSNCNKDVCRGQKYGIESSSTTGLEYGTLEQYKTDPPYYVWNVSGKKMVFFSEAEMLHQNKFRELCHRYLHIVPRKIPDDRWTKILNRANENIEVHESPDEVGGFSTGSQFIQHTYDFFTSRRPAEDRSQLALGRTYYDKELDQYVFKATAYLAYIRNVKDFKVYSPIELQTKMQKLGAVQEGPYWIIPKSKIPEPPPINIEIDFHDKDEGEDY